MAIGFHHSCALAMEEDRLTVSCVDDDDSDNSGGDEAGTSSSDVVDARKGVIISGSSEFPRVFQVVAAKRVMFRLEACTRDQKKSDEETSAFGYRCQVVAFPLAEIEHRAAAPTLHNVEAQV